MSFGENLQFLRKRENITQEQLAEQLTVSRQSISKWESDVTYPEMDKLLILCEMFHCDMDTLMRGSAERSSAADTCNYDAHMNGYSKAIAGGVGMILFGVVLACISEGLGWQEGISGLLLMAMVTPAVVIFITAGIRHGHFVEKYPHIEPFYTEAEIEKFENKFPIMIAAPVGLILMGVIWSIFVEEISPGLPLPVGANNDLYNSVLLLCVDIAVTILTYAGIQKSKYAIKDYNKENSPSPSVRKRNAKIGRWCGCIMMIATALFLLSIGIETMDFMKAKELGVDFVWKNSIMAFSWVVFPIGGILCGIVSVILSKEEEVEETEEAGE